MFRDNIAMSCPFVTRTFLPISGNLSEHSIHAEHGDAHESLRDSSFDSILFSIGFILGLDRFPQRSVILDVLSKSDAVECVQRIFVGSM